MTLRELKIKPVSGLRKYNKALSGRNECLRFPMAAGMGRFGKAILCANFPFRQKPFLLTRQSRKIGIDYCTIFQKDEEPTQP